MWGHAGDSGQEMSRLGSSQQRGVSCSEVLGMETRVEQGCWEGWGGREREEEPGHWHGEAIKQTLQLQQVNHQMNLLEKESEAREAAREELLLLVDKLEEGNINLAEELNRAKVKTGELESTMEVMTQELDELKSRFEQVEEEKCKLHQMITIEREEKIEEKRLENDEREEREARHEKLVEQLETENLNLQTALESALAVEPPALPPGHLPSQMLTPLLQESFRVHNRRSLVDTNPMSFMLDHSYDLSYSSSPSISSAGRGHSPAASLEDEMVACMSPKLTDPKSRRAMDFSPETPERSLVHLTRHFASSPLRFSTILGGQREKTEETSGEADLEISKRGESLGMSVHHILRHLLRFHKILSQSLMGGRTISL